MPSSVNGMDLTDSTINFNESGYSKISGWIRKKIYDMRKSNHDKDTRWYSDTIFSKVTSSQGNTCAQIFNSKSFVKVVPMRSEKEASKALKFFNEDVAFPTI